MVSGCNAYGYISSSAKKSKRHQDKGGNELNKRQLVCFGSAGAVGIPFYIFTKGVIGTQASALIMVALMLPFFFLAMYEKDGFPAEKILYFMLRQKILTPGIRPYKSENLYRQLEEKERMKKEVRYLEEKAAGRNAGQAG